MTAGKVSSVDKGKGKELHAMTNAILRGIRIVAFLTVASIGLEVFASEEYGLAVKDAGGRVVRYFADHALEKRDASVEYAVVLVHGVSGGSNDRTTRFREFVDSRRRGGKVFFVAPCFPILSMLNDNESKKIVYWEEGRWQAGHDSPVAKELSPYDVLDRIFSTLNDAKLYPRLKHVLFCGYSAGGQVISRYFAVTGIKPRKGVSVDFAAGAPSTWLYFDDKRVVAGQESLKVPDGDFKGYDHWHFGLNGRCRYAARVSDDQIWKNVQSRYLLCFCGTEDVKPKNLSVRPGAMAQGKNRIERFRNYRTHITSLKTISKSFRFVEVEGLEHDVRCYGHDAVVDLAFGIKDKHPTARRSSGASQEKHVKARRE